MTQTKLANLIDPQVMADIISHELENAIRFSPLAQVNTELQGRPGSTLTFPAWGYIGDATDVPEGTAIPLDQMSTSEKEVTIKKAGKGVEITDEAVLSGLGDPIGEATNQLRLAIANKVDSDLIEALDGATQTVDADVTTLVGLQTAIDLFSDEDIAQMVLVANPKDAAKLAVEARKEMAGSDVGANALINGTYMDILGVQIVRSNKVEEGNGYLVKQGALALVLKRGVEVEADRDIVNKTTIITADEHYAPYLYDDSKVVKFEAGE